MHKKKIVGTHIELAAWLVDILEKTGLIFAHMRDKEMSELQMSQAFKLLYLSGAGEDSDIKLQKLFSLKQYLEQIYYLEMSNPCVFKPRDDTLDSENRPTSEIS